MDSIQQMQFAIQVLHYTGPPVVLFYYLIAATVSVCILQTLEKSERKPQKLALYYMLFVMVTYIVEASMLVFDTFNNQPRRSTTDSNVRVPAGNCSYRLTNGLNANIPQVYTISSFLVWLILSFCLLDSKHPVWYPYYGSWLLALILEIGLFTLSLAICWPSSPFEYTLLIIQISRLKALNLLAAYLFASFSKAALEDHTSSDEKAPFLLQKDQPAEPGDLSNSVYGSAATETFSSDGVDLEYEAEDVKKEEERKRDVQIRLKANGNWFTYVCEFAILIPYIWPSRSKDRKLQWNVLGVVICLACIRALNVLMPYQLGIVINALETSREHVPLVAIGLYTLYSLASSSAGILSIKSW